MQGDSECRVRVCECRLTACECMVRVSKCSGRCGAVGEGARVSGA